MQCQRAFSQLLIGHIAPAQAFFCLLHQPAKGLCVKNWISLLIADVGCIYFDGGIVESRHGKCVWMPVTSFTARHQIYISLVSGSLSSLHLQLRWLTHAPSPVRPSSDRFWVQCRAILTKVDSDSVQIAVSCCSIQFWSDSTSLEFWFQFHHWLSHSRYENSSGLAKPNEPYQFTDMIS